MSRVVEFVDTTTRDGNQSLWSATGLTTPDVLAIAPTMDQVGYHALDFTSSTHMAVSVRFHQEDPWERIRLVSEAMPDTPLGMITTGMRFISWVPAEEELMRLSFRLVVRNGLRRVQIADPSNDPERIRRIAAMAKAEGVDEVVIGLTYSISEVHTHAYYVQRAAELADCESMDRLYLKDPGGLLTPDAVRELAPHFLTAAGDRPLELHSHCTVGLAPLVYVEGVQAGFSVVHTASGPLSRGTSQPEVRSTARNLQAVGYTVDLDLDAEAKVAEHFRLLALAKRLPAGAPREYDALYYRHQLPGGMVTTTRRMLEEVRRPELFDAVLDEVTHVRAEMGHSRIDGPIGDVQRTGRAVRVDSFAGTPRSDLARQFGVESGVAVPVAVEGRIWGALTASAPGRSLPVAIDERLAQFAELAAAAIANAETKAKLTESRARVVATADETRRRLQRDLHDGAQQRLVHTLLALGIAREAAANSRPAAELIDEAIHHAERANSELRDLVRGILPASLTRGGLRTAVESLVSDIAVPIDLHVTAPRLPLEIETTAYFIVAEALTNVVKHAHATRAIVEIRAEGLVLSIQVRDDGSGGADPAHGTGLTGLLDRVEASDGNLTITSPPTNGTMLHVTLPLGDPGSDHRHPEPGSPPASSDTATRAPQASSARGI